ncbi:MAG: hypothetical protein E7618_06940 [Ruminococcaceae bacterium]|nr:hypothetical protein [Oscillospiraceae bacterium]
MSELMQYKCPCCGGSIEFDVGTQKLKCPYCDTEFDVEALKHHDEALKEDTADAMSWEGPRGDSWQESEDIRVYTCQSCGGEIACEATTAATSCPYCGNPVVMTGRLAGELKPDLVVPFKLDKKAAKEGLKRHLKGKRLLPKIFKDENHIDEIKGIYVPFWLFDADADASIRYRATRTRIWSDSRYRYTETSHFALHRAGHLGFMGVPVDGSSKMDNALMESIEPYDLSQAVDFQTAYLAGYLADRYDVSSDDSIPRANERIKTTTEQYFASTISGYSSVVPERSRIRCEGGKVRYALLPVWLLSTSWQGKNYLFAMNGQTGKFVGDLPLDKKAYAIWLSVLTAGLTAASFVVLWLLSML